MTYVPASDRYTKMDYRRTGRSGLKLPAISLGLWNNFGTDRPLDTQRAILRRAFDLGVTHFDLANNYGTRPAARRPISAALARATPAAPGRDDHLHQGRLRHVGWPVRRMGIPQVPARLPSTPACGRLGLDYVDVFYSHRPDPETRSRRPWARWHGRAAGKALYVGISNYGPNRRSRQAPPSPSTRFRCSSTSPGTTCSIAGSNRDCCRCWTRWGGRHRIFSAGPGPAHRPLPDGIPADSRAAKGRWMSAKNIDAATWNAPAPSTRSPRSAGNPSPNGNHLGTASAAGRLGPRRRQQRAPARGQRGRTRRRPAQRRGDCGNRAVRSPRHRVALTRRGYLLAPLRRCSSAPDLVLVEGPPSPSITDVGGRP